MESCVFLDGSLVPTSLMDDKKLLKECRVVVTDLRTILPPSMLSYLTVPSLEDNEEVTIISEAVPSKGQDVPNFQVERNIVSDIACNEGSKIRTSVKTFKNLNIYKRKHSMSKSHKRRGHGVSSNSLSIANQTKNHLLQKYGRSLLRKPSFSIQPEIEKISSNCFDSDSKSSERNEVSPTKTPRSSEHFDCVNEVSQNILGQDNAPSESALPTRSSASIPESNTSKFNTQQNVVSCGKLLVSEPSCPMPPVGLSVNVGVGHKLPTLQAKCVLTCLEKCGNSLTPQYAEFSSSVVKGSSQSPLSKVLIPIDDERVLQLMQIKWKSRTVLQKIPFSIHKSSVKSLSEPEISSMPDPNIEIRNHSDVDELSTSVLNEKTDRDILVDKAKVSEGSGSKNAVCDSKDYKPVRKKRKSCLIPRSDYDGSYTADVSTTDYRQNSKEGTEVLQKLSRKRLSPNEKSVTENADRGNYSSKRRRLQFDDADHQNLSDPDDEIRNVTLKTMKNFPTPLYDPDDSRGVQSSEALREEPKEIKKSRKSHAILELQRLNVAVIDIPNNHEPVRCRTSDVCRLGCVCSSLTTRPVRDHCGLEKCIFNCVCVKFKSASSETSDTSYTWIQNKAKANLAKEEQHFKQTVVRSDKDGLILVEGRRKRQIKLPNRYREDFVADMELKPCRQFGSMKTVKEVLLQSQVTNKDNVSKSSKRNTAPRDVLIKHKEKVSSECDDVLDSSLEEVCVREMFESEDPLFSARTNVYDFKSREERQLKQKQLLKDSSYEQIKSESDLKIVSTQSLNAEEWDKSINKVENISNLELSCSALFKPSSNNDNKMVRLLSWRGLREDIDKKNAFVWIKSSSTRLKIYLTCSNVKPCENSIDVQSIDLLSHQFKDIPFHCKSLRSDYSLTETEEQNVWIVKSIKSQWMIVGYMQPGQKKRTLSQSSDIDVMSPPAESFSHRWWVMDIEQNFDLIYFMDFKKAITKDQIVTLVKLSNEYSESETKVHRILLNRRRPKIDPRPTPYPDFGAYSLPSHPKQVIIGPYDYSKEPRFHVYAQKVSQSEKTEYEKIPLFYSGGGEFVRVNSHGALSLHSEKPPEKYVQGSWYESSEIEFRHLDAQTPNPEPITNQAESEGDPTSRHETESDLTDYESSSKNSTTNQFGPGNDECNGSDNESVRTWSESSNDCVTEKPEDHQSELAPLVERNILNTNISCSKEPELEEENWLQTEKDSCEEKPVDNSQELPELEIEYLVPSVRSIGVLPVTYLPSDTLSVPHFTQPDLIQFFHTREELIQQINRLIHFKLACLHQKCSVVLKRDQICRCIAWRTVWEKEKCGHLPQFSPKIFNGYFMLTKYGLLDIRIADSKTIRKLGEDWVDWLKEDEFDTNLTAWMKGEKEENRDVSNLSLPTVMKWASKGIVERNDKSNNKVKRLMKETLVSSLSRKLNGIPASVVPNFLELLDLDLLWESQQSISSPKIHFETSQNTSKGNSKTIDEPLTKSAKSVLKKSAIDDCSKNRSNKAENGPHHQPNEQKLKVKLTPSPGKNILNDNNGLACRLSPFSRLNICVEEGGIKYTPLSSPPRSSSPVEGRIDLLTSPGKQPIILKRNKSVVVDSSTSKSVMPIVNHISKQTRKQTFSFSSDTGEEPVFLGNPEDSTNPFKLRQREKEQTREIEIDFSPRSKQGIDFQKVSKAKSSRESLIHERSCSAAVTALFQKRDKEPHLKISSVGSGATFWHEPPSDLHVEADPLRVQSSDSTPNLQISSVFSTRSLSPSLLATENELHSGDDAVSSEEKSPVASSLNSKKVLSNTVSSEQKSQVALGGNSKKVLSNGDYSVLKHRGLRQPATLVTTRNLVKINDKNKVVTVLKSIVSRDESAAVGASKPLNSQNALKIVSNSSGSVTVSVPKAALKICSPNSINRKFQPILSDRTEDSLVTNQEADDKTNNPNDTCAGDNSSRNKP